MAAEVRSEQLTRPPRRDDGRIDVDRLVAALGPAEDVALLDAAPGHGARWTYVCAPARGRLVSTPDGSRLTRTGGPARTWTTGDPLAVLDEVAAEVGVERETPPGDTPAPFSGGLVGALSYDLARCIEQLPSVTAADRRVPLQDWRLVDTVVAIDHLEDRAWLVHRRLPATSTTDLAEVRARLAAAPPVPSADLPTAARVVTSLPPDAYVEAVGAALDEIAAGNAFQVNVTQRLTARWDGSAHALYRALRAATPAPYGAVLPGDAAVVGVSPETFLAVDGDRVRVRPIKGTRPRGRDRQHDDRLARELAASPKDRAENVMVVDMERNDLGRVCRVGSVHVPELLALEPHPTVWHLVSTVEGRLCAGVSWGELVRATFPCGSVTGTPKVAAMAIIDRLEPVRRGWYCGAYGFLSPGHAHLAVAIRTATRFADGTVDYGAGGGVVADSVPADEHAESLDKAAAFLRAVRATHVGVAPGVRS